MLYKLRPPAPPDPPLYRKGFGSVDSLKIVFPYSALNGAASKLPVSLNVPPGL